MIGTNTDSEHWYEQFFIDCFAEHGCAIEAAEVRALLKQAARSFPEDSRCSSDAQTRRFWEHVYGEIFTHVLCPHGMTDAGARTLACQYIDRFESGEYVQLFAGAKDTLTELRNRGYSLGIISNFATYLRRFLSRLELTDLLDFVVISAEHNCEKPGTALFETGLQHCNGAPPNQVLYIGDNLEEDYHPAQALGMAALLIDRHGKYAHHESLKRISHLDEVLDHI